MRMLRRKNLARSSHPEEESLVNLTPLIDVVFVVLIMFILVAPMLELDRVELTQHLSGKQKESAPVQEQSSIVLHVLRDNSILLNGQKIFAKDLIPLLQEQHRKNPNKNPQLFHDRQAFFETYQAIKDAAEIAGFDELDVIVKPN
jgi:biopolymer transport protein ExbD